MNTSQALDILKSYSSSQYKIPADSSEKETLRQAIRHITALSERENIGICTNRIEDGLKTLQEYLHGLGYKPIDISPVILESEGVYLKYNTYRMTHLIEPYAGEYRGVLISCQSDDPTIAATYGYFPLDLFVTDESRQDEKKESLSL